jgi:protein gp37
VIGPLGKLNLKKINWMITGGESGPGARPILQQWVTDIRDQRLRAKVPFFFK